MTESDNKLNISKERQATNSLILHQIHKAPSKSKAHMTLSIEKTAKPRSISAPFSDPSPKSKEEKFSKLPTLSENISSKSIFPSTSQHYGFLDVRTSREKPWKRRYFVVNNNFLLSAATPHAKKLERMICLEGSKTQKSLKSSDMTFELFIRKHKLYFRTGSPGDCEKWTKSIEKASKLRIKDIYRFMYELGEGQAHVKVVAAKHKITNEECAIKIVDKRKCDKKMLKTEIQILKKIEHENIVAIYDLIETKKYLYVIMEKCNGGELFDRIAELDGEGMNEEDICLIMHQVCDAVNYFHDKGIVHRDLKPENILCSKPNSIKQIKLCDFGISKMLKSKTQKMSTLCGTVSYTAPEVLRQKKSYDLTVDYWSIGVIMFILCCGYPPFYGETDLEVEKAIIHEKVAFDDEDWEHIDKNCKKLVTGLLHKDPRKRLGADDVLKLTWRISAKSISFKKSHQKFKETVLRSKFQRHSLSNFEKDPIVSRQMFRSFKPQTNDEDEKKAPPPRRSRKKKSIKRTSRIGQQQPLFIKTRSSKDDMDAINDRLHSMEQYNKKIESFRGNYRRSKGTEELLQLSLPISWTHSPLPVVQDVSYVSDDE